MQSTGEQRHRRNTRRRVRKRRSFRLNQIMVGRTSKREYRVWYSQGIAPKWAVHKLGGFL